MLPIEQFILAVLSLAGYLLLRYQRLPIPRVTALVFVGCQFPDFVDKPLTHQFVLLPSGGVFSLPIPVPFPAVHNVLQVLHTSSPAIGVFTVVHLPHLFTDNYRPLLGPTPTVSPGLL